MAFSSALIQNHSNIAILAKVPTSDASLCYGWHLYFIRLWKSSVTVSLNVKTATSTTRSNWQRVSANFPFFVIRTCLLLENQNNQNEDFYLGRSKLQINWKWWRIWHQRMVHCSQIICSLECECIQKKVKFFQLFHCFYCIEYLF